MVASVFTDRAGRSRAPWRSRRMSSVTTVCICGERGRGLVTNLEQQTDLAPRRRSDPG